jgi:hypothetical protein
MRALTWLSFVAMGIATIGACGDDEEKSSSPSSTSTSASTGSGGMGGQSCMGDLTGQAGGDLVCDAQASDTECVSCTRMTCCDELQGCLPDANCQCLLGCFLAGCDPVECLADCGSSGPVQDLIGCVSGSSAGGSGGANSGCPVCLQTP